MDRAGAAPRIALLTAGPAPLDPSAGEAHVLWRALTALARVDCLHLVDAAEVPGAKLPAIDISRARLRRLGVRLLVRDERPQSGARLRRRLARLLSVAAADMVVVAHPAFLPYLASITRAERQLVLLGDWPAATGSSLPPRLRAKGKAWWHVGRPLSSSRAAAARAGLTLEVLPPVTTMALEAPAQPGPAILLWLDEPGEFAAGRALGGALVRELRRSMPSAWLQLVGPGADPGLCAVCRSDGVPSRVERDLQRAVERSMAILLLAGRPAQLSPALLSLLGTGLPVLLADGKGTRLPAALRRHAILAANPEALALRLLEGGEAARASGERLAAAAAESYGLAHLVRRLAGLLGTTPLSVSATLRPFLALIDAIVLPAAGLLVVRLEIDLAVPASALSARLVGADGSSPPDASFSVAERPGQRRIISCSALQPGTGSADALEPAAVEVCAWGMPIGRVDIDQPLARAETGLLSVDRRANGRVRLGLRGPASEMRIAIDGRPLAPSSVEQRNVDGQLLQWIDLQLPLGARRVDACAGEGVGVAMPALDAWLRPRAATSCRLEALEGCHAGAAAWLVGNGPSVRGDDLDRLEGRLSFAFNRFHLAHARTRFRPTYTVTADASMIADFGQEIVDRSAGTVLVADERLPDLLGDFIWLRASSLFPFPFSLDPALQVSTGGSSLYVAMQLARFMGIRRLYLYGCDLGFRYSAGETSSRTASGTARGDGNHFIDGYRGNRSWRRPAYDCIAESFATARAVLAADGGFIRNAGRGGALEIFERSAFEQAIAES